MKHVLPFLVLLPSIAFASPPEHNLTIKDHQFSPTELRMPAGKKVKLIVNNLDNTPEEFESHDLNREKLVAGNSTAIIYVGPLKPGKYAFFGEFHEDTARGVIVVE